MPIRSLVNYFVWGLHYLFIYFKYLFLYIHTYREREREREIEESNLVIILLQLHGLDYLLVHLYWHMNFSIE